MLTGGYAPCLPCWPIREIKLQGKIDGFDTDDLIVFVQGAGETETRKLLGQVKHGLRIGNNKRFEEVIQAAWDDFCDTKRFSRGKDIIAVISDSMSTTDSEDVCWLLDQTRCTKSPDEFLRNVNEAYFSSDQKRKKLIAFQEQLKKANNGCDVSDADLHLFLKHFYLLGYDLGKEEGVVLSLLHSHISQFNRDKPRMVWGRIVDIVQTWSQNAGTITKDNLPEDLLKEFKKPVIESIPESIVRKPPPPPSSSLLAQPHVHDLGLAFLLGGWQEGVAGDTQIVSQLVNAEYIKWISSIRDALEVPGAPIGLHNGVWTTRQRAESWELLGKKIFDADIDTFQKIAVEVLTERNPAFELPGEERYMANIKGKVLSHSSTLREGIADTLAVIGSKPKIFVTISDGKAETVALLVVRQVLIDADWMLWGSLNDLLPLLAEASPDEFLSAVEKTLQKSPSPFVRLFAEEGKGFTGSNYMTGLLWALESLAWDARYLTRVTVILGELGAMDPGGNWSNRPSNSITTIFLPWLPQTMAPVDKRFVAIRTLVKELPNIAWPILLNLLPNQHQMSMGSYKPRWRQQIPDDRNKGVSLKEYWAQVEFYAELALQLAEKDVSRLLKLVDKIDALPPPAIDNFLKHLSSDCITKISEKDRNNIWSALLKFTAKHRKFADAKWALGKDILERIDAVTNSLSPKKPSDLYRRLFCGRDLELYEERGEWELQAKKLQQKRFTAIGEIYASGGAEAILQFAESVDSPLHVGVAFGEIASDDDDATLLPKYLENQSDKISLFIAHYVSARHRKTGWAWIDKILSPDWSVSQIGFFLRSLPFCTETWNRVISVLGNNTSEYWTKVNFHPYCVDGDYNYAIDKLLEYGRPHLAIDCLQALQYKKQPIDHNRVVKALLAAVSSEERASSMDVFNAVELIKALQSDEKTSPDDLFKIEWAYLAVLDEDNGAKPRLLEHRLAVEPAFFCEIIRLVFRSRHEKEPPKDPGEKQMKIAGHAYELLHKWKTPPGTQLDGSFQPAEFDKWLAETKAICEKTGHLEVALSLIGQVLIYGPPDPSGLWIHKTVAEALNAKDAEAMRSGFQTGVFNSRGVHCVDPTGKPEKELAEKYKKQADEVERAGYHRFATTMRSLSDSYIREAERVMSKYRLEQELEASKGNAANTK